MDEENDLFYHALNYRGARSQDAELFWKELEACMNRLIAAEREACAKECETTSNHPSSLWEEAGCWKHSAQNCADAIRERSNVELNGERSESARTEG